MSPGRAGALASLRRELHRIPEPSGLEVRTAAMVTERVEALRSWRVVGGLGGHGLAACLDTGGSGPTILVRAELDALPIAESGASAHASANPGFAHACGHDGHLAILLGLAEEFAESPPPRGRVILLFQPAEETGEGAARVLADPAFAPFRPDEVYALHNLPGIPLGEVRVRPGPMTCASTGLSITLTGRTSHAAEPEAGLSPRDALAELLERLPRIPESLPGAFTLLTITHARLGERTFGISPGEGELVAVLRAETDETLEHLAESVREEVREIAGRHGLGCGFEGHEPFAATVNDPVATARVVKAAAGLGIPVVRPEAPFRWSEDFGEWTRAFPGALFVLGAGEDHSPLHASDYDFPDALLEPGVALFRDIVRGALGSTD